MSDTVPCEFLRRLLDLDGVGKRFGLSDRIIVSRV